MKDVKATLFINKKQWNTQFKVITYPLPKEAPGIDYSGLLNAFKTDTVNILSIEIQQQKNGRWYRIAPAGPLRRLWNWLRGYRR